MVTHGFSPERKARPCLLWWVCVDAVFLLKKLQLFFLLLGIHLLKCPVGIIVQHHEVSVTDIESRQVITGILGIKDVFIDHVSCSSSFWSIPDSDLPNRPIFPKYVIHFFSCDLVRQISYVQNPVYFRRKANVRPLRRLHRHLGGPRESPEHTGFKRSTESRAANPPAADAGSRSEIPE